MQHSQDSREEKPAPKSKASETEGTMSETQSKVNKEEEQKILDQVYDGYGYKMIQNFKNITVPKLNPKTGQWEEKEMAIPLPIKDVAKKLDEATALQIINLCSEPTIEHDGEIIDCKKEDRFLGILGTRFNVKVDFKKHSTAFDKLNTILYAVSMNRENKFDRIHHRPLFCASDKIYFTKNAKYNLRWKELWDHYLTFQGIEKPHSYLDELVSFWPNVKGVNSKLLKAMFITGFCGNFNGAKPLFIITAEEGAGRGGKGVDVGKSTIAKLLFFLLGEHESQIEGALDAKSDKDFKQMFSKTSKGVASMALFDNMKTIEFDTVSLEKALTAKEFEAFKKGEDDILVHNDVIWVMTYNAPTMNTDLASRCVTISVGATKKIKGWEARVYSYISEHRDKIIAEIGALIEHAAHRDSKEDISNLNSILRFSDWLRQIGKICCDMNQNDIEAMDSKQESLDYTQSKSEELEEAFLNNFRDRVVDVREVDGYKSPNSVNWVIPNHVFAIITNNVSGGKKKSHQRCLDYAKDCGLDVQKLGQLKVFAYRRMTILVFNPDTDLFIEPLYKIETERHNYKTYRAADLGI